MEDVLHQRRMIGNKYELGSQLGEGTYGVTYLCRDLVTHETLACKAISKAHMDTKEEIENIYNEVTIMMKLPDHPNIVKLKAFCEDRNNFYLIMELCKGGELVDLIKVKNYLSEAEAAPVAKMIVKAIMTCHTNGIMHRDLKPENLLFLNNKQDSPLKLIDFGFSAFFKPNQRFSNIVGTLYYAAPEILSKWKCHGPEVDIWSAGVIIYIMLCGNFPFYPEFSDDSSYDHSITQMSCAILKGDIDFQTQPWPRISESAKSLIRQMLERDPKKRLTAQQVLGN
uniref:Protein kinase domain-containing protein n=1 Tax=Cannabis sativa TaxID=3483 RepID=A0A803PFT7_CANSA